MNKEIQIKIDEFFKKIPEFTKFLQDMKIDPIQYKTTLYNYKIKSKRYVRISYKANKNQINEFINNTNAQQTFIENVYELDGSQSIYNIDMYQKGLLYGIDFGSLIIIEILNLQSGENYLDLCCAPGSKLVNICDKLNQQKSKDKKSIIVGNDINNNRLNIARSLIKKYCYEDQITLINLDGICIDKKDFSFEFDKVLADVECSHDGSLKHILKYIFKKEKIKKVKKVEQNKKISKKEIKRRLKQKQNTIKKNEWSIDDFKSQVLLTHKKENIFQLQKNLLKNALKLIKVGGEVIYSTCSLSYYQNEFVVDSVLKSIDNYINIFTIIDLPVQIGNDWQYYKEYGFKEGQLKGTIKLDPTIRQIGAIFIAKIKKNLPYNNQIKFQIKIIKMKSTIAIIIFFLLKNVLLNKKDKQKSKEPKKLTSQQQLEQYCTLNTNTNLTIDNKIIENQKQIVYQNYIMYELKKSTEDKEGLIVYKILPTKNQTQQYYESAVQILEQLQKSGNVRNYFGSLHSCYIHKYRNIIQYNWFSAIYIIVTSTNTQAAMSRQRINFHSFSTYRFSIKFYYFKKILRFYEIFLRKGFKNIKLSPRYIFEFNSSGFTLNLMLLGNYMITTKENPNPSKIDLFNQIQPYYQYPNLKQQQLTDAQILASDQFNLGIIFIELFGINIKKDLKNKTSCLLHFVNNCIDQVALMIVYKNFKLFLKQDQEKFLEKFSLYALNVFFTTIDSGQFLDSITKLHMNQFFLDFYDIKICNKDILMNKLNVIQQSYSERQKLRIYKLQDQNTYQNFSYLIFQEFNFSGFEPNFILDKDDNIQLIKDQMFNKTSQLRLYLAGLDNNIQNYLVDRVINTQSCSYDDSYIYIKINLIKNSLYSGLLESSYESVQNKKFDKVNLFHQALIDYVRFVQDMNNIQVKVLNFDPNIVYYTTVVGKNFKSYNSKVLFLPQTMTEIFQYNKQDEEKRIEMCKYLYKISKSPSKNINIENSLQSYCSQKIKISKISDQGLIQIITFNYISMFDTLSIDIDYALSYVENFYKDMGVEKIGTKFRQILQNGVDQKLNFSSFISSLQTITVV